MNTISFIRYSYSKYSSCILSESCTAADSTQRRPPYGPPKFLSRGSQGGSILRSNTLLQYKLYGYPRMLVKHFAAMAPPKDDGGDTLPSFSLWQKIKKVPLLLGWRESQPSDYLHLLMRPHIISQLLRLPSGSSSRIRAALGAVPRTSRRCDTSWETCGTLQTVKLRFGRQPLNCMRRGRVRVAQTCLQMSFLRVQCCTGLAQDGRTVYSYFYTVCHFPPLSDLG